MKNKQFMLSLIPVIYELIKKPIVLPVIITYANSKT